MLRSQKGLDTEGAAIRSYNIDVHGQVYIGTWIGRVGETARSYFPLCWPLALVMFSLLRLLLISSHYLCTILRYP